LQNSYKGNINLATIIYLHRISDNRMSGSVLRNLQVFTTLCGQKAMPNVVITTTMWGEARRESAERREAELKREFWKDMVDDGCRIERFQDSYQSAWKVIGKLSNKDSAKVLLPREIVDASLRLNETQAGIALNKELEKLIKDRKETARRLWEQMGNQTNDLVVQELNQRKAELDAKIHQTADQLREMKIPFTRKIRLFFRKNHI
jgi:chromosome condensin MukBEF ATPase and DNA-binding subunit MukB